MTENVTDNVIVITGFRHGSKLVLETKRLDRRQALANGVIIRRRDHHAAAEYRGRRYRRL